MPSDSITAIERQPGTPEELLKLIETRADASVLQQLGVPKKFEEKFIGETEQAVELLATAAQGILVREFRQDLDRLVTTLRAMTRNFRNDPQDIDEELALPGIIRDIAAAVDEYGTHVSRPRGREQHAETLAKIEKDIKETHLPWARRLLDRMTANDTLPAAERLNLSTAFFKEE